MDSCMGHVVLGIDQSYSKIGFAAVTKGRILRADTVDLRKLKWNSQRRLAVRALMLHWIETYKPKVIMVERVRLFGGSRIALGTIQQLSAMTAVIVDTAFTHQTYSVRAMGIIRKSIPVYSVDTRAWKSQILGSAKADKEESLIWLGKKYKLSDGLDNNAGDAAAIASYAFVPEPKVKRER
jgi:Holliday junction resolvasome RuvABC endonuclease subunit